ncbi:MAG: TonB-dependent receptor [Verrucomicrobia bacterium]|nr:TonB-dependent receptor [Verrucomicrobiota bacterium]MCH8511684.1 TonB-dependent receptor [Kiritimatiellia bacterium]
MTHTKFPAAVLLIPFLLNLCRVHADGFRNPPAGAAALGRIGGRIAYTEDATAITHNPANLVDLTEPSLLGALTFGYSKMEFEGPAGTAESKSPWAVLPNMYAVRPVPEEGRWAFGVGLNSPYGRSTELDEGSIFRFAAPYYTQLLSVELLPTFATRLNDRLAFGFSVNLLWSELDIRQSYPWALALQTPGLPDGKTKFQADGAGIGATLALTWKVAENQRLAVSYRSPIKVEYEGDLDVTEIPEGAPAAARSDFETEITFPMVVAVAYGIQVTDRLLLETNVEWARQSSFDKLELDAGVNTPLLPSNVIDTDWGDNWTYGISAAWKLNQDWQLRTGYIYLESPVPSRTMLPTTAEQSQGVWSIGAGYFQGSHRLDFAYSLGLFSGRQVDDNENPLFNGKYDFEAHLVSVSYGYHF